MRALIVFSLSMTAATAHASAVHYHCETRIQQSYPREELSNTRREFDVSFDDKVEEDGSYGSSEAGEQSVSLPRDISITTRLWLQNAAHATGGQLQRKLKMRVSVAVADHEERATTSTVDFEQPAIDLQLDDNLRADVDCLRK